MNAFQAEQWRNEMIRTQIQLDEARYRKLRQVAREQGQSMAEVVRSGVDPLIARITRVVPLASQERETLGVKREATSLLGTTDVPLLANNPSSLTPHSSRGLE